MGLLLSRSHLHGENNSPQSAFYTDRYSFCAVFSLKTGRLQNSRFFFFRSPQSRSLFSASLTTFCLTARAYLNTQRYGLFCSLKAGIDFAHFGLESGMVFEGTTGVYERIYRFNSE